MTNYYLNPTNSKISKLGLKTRTLGSFLILNQKINREKLEIIIDIFMTKILF